MELGKLNYMGDSILLMPFIDESESFTKGFECGQIWELLEAGEMIDNRPCHEENKEQIKMICELFNCNYTLEEAGYGWIYLTVKPIII